MDFTREPIIETIITPREGHKLVVRSSKNVGQEEYFVDAVEIISFGEGLFFRSLERPKAFLVPISDYEVLEVREARVVLKSPSFDRSIKIGGGQKTPKGKEEREVTEEPAIESLEKSEPSEATPLEDQVESRPDKKRDRRRNHRKRKGKEESKEEESVSPEDEVVAPLNETEETRPETLDSEKEQAAVQEAVTPAQLSALLQPPPTLVSETINRYRQNDMFKGAFYLSEEEQYKPHDKVNDLLYEEDGDDEPISLQEPIFADEGVPQESENVQDSPQHTEDEDKNELAP